MKHRPILRALLTICLAVALVPMAPARAGPGPDEAAAREILVMLKLPPPHFRPNATYGGSYGDAMSRTARRRTALGIARKNRLDLIDGWPMPLLGVDCYVMHVPDGVSTEAAAQQVARDPAVAWSEPMRLYRGRAAPGKAGDPLFKAQPASGSWRLADLHRVSTGRGVSVAVIDSKIETGHPDLSGQFSTSQDFVSNRSAAPEQHGTGVAGIIAAKADNGIGIAGIAPGARLMALRACWQTGAGATLCDTLSLAKALQYAIEHDAQVINLSLSGPPDSLLEKLIAVALAHRVSVVAAFDPALPRGGFPASQAGVIAVTDESLQILPPGLYGAPGRDVPTTQPGGRWYLVNGSSYAAAHVSGLIALVREYRRPAAPIAIARSALGSVDACATLLRTTAACGCSCMLDRATRTAGK